MKSVFFSVIVPTFERPRDLETCLNALKKENQTTTLPYEIIVSDDSKTNHSRKLVEEKFPKILWGCGKKNGPAGNRNAGTERAIGKWLVFIDDDCIAEKEFLKAYSEAIEQNSAIEVFEGRIFADRPRKTWAEGCPENSQGGMFWTSNLCVKKSTFERLEGFDERFRVAYEDVEFAHRIKQFRIPTDFVYKASVCHPWRSLRSGGKNWKNKGYQIESLLLFLAKHADAYSLYGKPRIYLRNFIRTLTKDLFFCLFFLGGRGVDVLFKQAFVSLKTIIILSRPKSDK